MVEVKIRVSSYLRDKLKVKKDEWGLNTIEAVVTKLYYDNEIREAGLKNERVE